METKIIIKQVEAVSSGIIIRVELSSVPNMHS